ncbi:MAG: hypothetical protein ACE3JP_07350, partial [Ectobacillus sp.]
SILIVYKTDYIKSKAVCFAKPKFTPYLFLGSALHEIEVGVLFRQNLKESAVKIIKREGNYLRGTGLYGCRQPH